MSYSWNRGWEDGYKQGSEEGRFLGRCEAVRRSIPPKLRAARKIRLIFVTSGLGIPYNPLDLAIIDAFKEQVSEVLVMLPSENVASQAAQFRPDLVFVLNGMVFQTEQVNAIRAKGIRTAIWFTDDPYYTDVTHSIAVHYDYIFTLESNCITFYQQFGCQYVYHLPFAADVNVFRPKHTGPQFHKDISFIGTAYWKRVEVFEKLVPYLSKKNVHISGWWWDRLPNYSLIAEKIALNDWMSPEGTASYYIGSKIVINMHRSVDEDTWNSNKKYKIPALSVNPRTFEISASGAFQLTDVRQDLERCYTPGVEIATYGSGNDLVEKLEYYLEHEEERKNIALHGMSRSLRDHTYANRVSQILNTIFDNL